MSAPSPQLAAKGFLASLFDFGFTSFVTLRFLKLIYTVLVALILLAGLIVLIAGLSRGGGAAVVSLVLVPLLTLLYLIFARIYTELIALFFRIGENTAVIASALAGGQPTAGYGYPAGGPPPPAPPYGAPGS